MGAAAAVRGTRQGPQAQVAQVVPRVVAAVAAAELVQEPVRRSSVALAAPAVAVK